MKSSDKIQLLLYAGFGAAVLVSVFHHGDAYRDRYRSREDCQRDWGDNELDCREREHYGVRSVYGPSYERGARPITRAPQLLRDTTLVERAGFGGKGARFTRGGS